MEIFLVAFSSYFCGSIPFGLILTKFFSGKDIRNIESKRLTFAKAATGATGIETLLPLALELFHNDSLKLKTIIASITSNPAKILGIDKGSLRIGADADLCVVDINKPWVVNKDNLLSKSKNTPIEDRKLQGQIIKTFIKGEIAFTRA